MCAVSTEATEGVGFPGNRVTIISHHVVLGTQSGSSGRTASTVNWWADTSVCLGL